MTAPARLRLTAPLSLWSGLDPATGTIRDPTHPQFGACIAGTVLELPGTTGSTSGPSVLADCLRRGQGPVRIVVDRPDASLLAATAVARWLYGVECPVRVRGSGAGQGA